MDLYFQGMACLNKGWIVEHVTRARSFFEHALARDRAAQAKFGPEARAKRVDITNPEEVERAAKDAETAMGHIDILVCSAGVAGLNADVVDYPIDVSTRFRPSCRIVRHVADCRYG
jgi:NAD(P)-dependent dehydrogenase (short-subunit alcohol dehydrogenase family)